MLLVGRFKRELKSVSIGLESDELEPSAMNRVFWREQQAAALVAVVGGVLFWLGYSLVKGMLFALAILLILQLPILVAHWKRRRR
jgi:preprotein translocase subunit SecD